MPNQVAIGELITYAIVITVPEGVLPNVVVSDSLAAGLAYANFITITTSPGITRAGGFTGVVTPTVSPINATEAAGRTAAWNIGTLFNANNSNTPQEAITITYAAVMLNTSSNQAGATHTNTAFISYSASNLNVNTIPVTTPPVTVVEPALQVGKFRAAGTSTRATV